MYSSILNLSLSFRKLIVSSKLTIIEFAKTVKTNLGYRPLAKPAQNNCRFPNRV